MNFNKNITKFIIFVAISGYSAFSFAVRWFDVDFGEEGLLKNSYGSDYGVWNEGDWDFSYFADERLFVDDEEVLYSVPQSPSFPGSAVVKIALTVSMYGYDELPEVPSVGEGYKAAVAPVEGGNYFVLGYDPETRENEWVDSGVAFVADRDVSVEVNFRMTNDIFYATYGFDGSVSREVRVVDMDVRDFEFVGCGTVSGLSAAVERGIVPVEVCLPVVEGVISRLADGRSMVYPGEVVEVDFEMDTCLPSRFAARYRVADDGSLVFVDEGEEPYGRVIVAEVGGYPYESFAEAVAAAGTSYGVRLLSDIVLDRNVLVDCAWLDLNGYYIVPSAGGVKLTLDTGFVFSDSWDRFGAIHASVILKQSLSVDERVGIFDITLGGPGVVLETCYPVPYSYSSDIRYVVEETADEWGWFTYRLVENPNYEADRRAPAYLLDCAPYETSAALEDFRIISIDRKDGEWIVKVTGGKTHGDRYGNGYVNIKRVEVPGGSSSDGSSAFFRAELVPDPPDAK